MRDSPIFLECDRRLDPYAIEQLGEAASALGVSIVLLPPGCKVATEQRLLPDSIDVQIGHFSLKYGVDGIIGLWDARINGKRLPPNRKITITIGIDDSPSIKVDFVGLVKCIEDKDSITE